MACCHAHVQRSCVTRNVQRVICPIGRLENLHANYDIDIITAHSELQKAPPVWFFGRPFVKRFALYYQTVVCLSVLSVTLVYCGQTVGWIKMKLGREVGLDLGHIMLDGTQLPKRGTVPPLIFGLCIVGKQLDGLPYSIGRP